MRTIVAVGTIQYRIRRSLRTIILSFDSDSARCQNASRDMQNAAPRPLTIGIVTGPNMHLNSNFRNPANILTSRAYNSKGGAEASGFFLGGALLQRLLNLPQLV